MNFIQKVFSSAILYFPAKKWAALAHSPSKFMFSTFFEKQDDQEIEKLQNHRYRNKQWLAIHDKWKKPLERKKLRRERLKAVKQAKPEPEVDIEKIVVHNEAVGIEYPPKKWEEFAIVKVDGFQYKVMEDTTLVLDIKPDHEINKLITFENVLLYGTKTFSVIGRPFIRNAKVEAIIESISDSEKIIVFKKKRRKQYKKSMGFRATLTTCRITKIIHQLNNDAISKAVALM